METVTYGSNEIIGEVVTVSSGGTVAVSRGFNSTIGILGNMNTNKGTAKEGQVEVVPSPSDAEGLFGENSELDRQVRLAYGNGVYEVLAVGVGETSTTETFSNKSSGVLTKEIADPNVTNHKITAVDTASKSTVEVKTTYESPVTQPSSGSSGGVVMLVNPVTREIAFSTTGSYDVTYTAMNFDGAIDAMYERNIRLMAMCSENEEVLNNGLLAVKSRADVFDFKRAMGGSQPSANPTEYSDSLSSQRMVLTMPSRGYMGEAQTEETRTVGAIAGVLGSKPLGDTATNENFAGFVDIPDYPVSALATFDSKGLLTLQDTVAGHKIIRDKTTSNDIRFSRVYACEIIDDFAYTSHLIADQFIGRLNIRENRVALEMSLKNAVSDAKRQNLLDDGVVEVYDGPAADEVTAEIGLDIVDVIDRIYVDITVGPILEFGGTDENVDTSPNTSAGTIV